MLVSANMPAATINIIPNAPVIMLLTKRTATIAAIINLIILSAAPKFLFIVILFNIYSAKLQCKKSPHSDICHIMASFFIICI